VSHPINMIGKQFGRLTVTAKYDTTKGVTRWVCLCSCGQPAIVKGCHLRSGLIRSCGCFRRDTTWAKGEKSPNWKGGIKPDYRKRHLLKKYGMTPSDYERIWTEQGGVCAICGLPELRRRLSVDHDHKTGKIRGLLCDRCNLAFGLLQDDLALLDAMKKYGETHHQSSGLRV